MCKMKCFHSLIIEDHKMDLSNDSLQYKCSLILLVDCMFTGKLAVIFRKATWKLKSPSAI